jgi:hypothetical protein
VVMCEAGVSKRTPLVLYRARNGWTPRSSWRGPREPGGGGAEHMAVHVLLQRSTTSPPPPPHPSAPRGGVARPDRPSPIMRSVLARRVRSCGQPVADGARSDTAVLPRGFLAGQSRPLGPAVRLWMCLSLLVEYRPSQQGAQVTKT